MSQTKLSSYSGVPCELSLKTNVYLHHQAGRASCPFASRKFLSASHRQESVAYDVMWNWARLQRRTVVVAPTVVIGTVYPSALECSTAWERYFQFLKPFWSPWLCLLEFLNHFLSGFTILEMQNKTVWLVQFAQQHLGERCLKNSEVSASWMSITRPPHGRKHPHQQVQVNTCHSTASTSEKTLVLQTEVDGFFW